MASICSDDPVACIDFVALFMGEFLKDWTTMAMLAVLFVLLLKLRADKRRVLELAYARQLVAYDDKRRVDQRVSTWLVDDDKGPQAGER